MIAALVVLSVCFASAAHGATSDFWVSFGPWSLPHASQTFDLPKFDPALGPLTQVDFILSGTAFAGTIEWDGEGGLPTDLTLGIGAEMTATGPVSLSVVTAPMQEGSTHIPDDDDDGYPPDFAGPDYFAVTGNTGSDSATQTWTSAGDLAFFTQTAPGDTFSVDVSAEDKMLIETTGGGWGVPQAVFGQVNGTATVRYHFEAIVPEPSSIALLLLGVCPAVLLRRRRPRTRS
jgi:hypothetical protein